MTTNELREKKNKLLAEFKILAEKKKRLYSDMPIDSPMSEEEKELNRIVSYLASEINSIIKQISRVEKYRTIEG